MCGIAGIFNLNKKPVSVDVLKNMLSQIRYRGPDESGIYIDDNLGIGNVRLSIIDLSTGQQPMANSDNSIWIVFNGEIFNYIELRQELIKKGIYFKTNSDTEVILKYYEYYGEKCLEYFNGQFAFAIWNQKEESLFLARDRVGIRPLFYSMQNNQFIFGSEIKAILASEQIDAEIDYKGLQQVFHFWATISPNTCFKNIFEVPPGHYVQVNKNSCQVSKYWELKFPLPSDTLISDLHTAKNELDELLEDAVRLRLRADVPVAAYLSGGIDSSATTHYIKKIDYQHLNTFSIGFADTDFDETIYQKEVSKYLETQHHAITCSNQDIANYFPEIIKHTEIPVTRTAPVPMYLLSRLVRNHNIKVVVTGEGADEMLGGYNIFKEMYIRQFWSRYPDSKYRPLLLKKLYPYIPLLQNQNGKVLKFFFGYKLNETTSPFYSHLLRWNNTSKLTGFLHPEIREYIAGHDPYQDIVELLDTDFYSYNPLAKAQWLESRIFMSGYLLSSQGDRMAMANSVEGRYPFLDHRVIEFCSRLHPDLKLNGLNEKYILKKLVTGKIPDSVVNRSKQAYRAPIAGSFFSSNRPDYVDELLSEEAVKNYGIFDSLKTTSLIDKLEENPASEIENMALAAILSTQILYRQFIVSKFEPSKNMNDCKVLLQDIVNTK